MLKIVEVKSAEHLEQLREQENTDYDYLYICKHCSEIKLSDNGTLKTIGTQNQNAFSAIAVEDKVIEATDTTDVLTLVPGENVIIEPKDEDNKIVIKANDTTYTIATDAVAGLVKSGGDIIVNPDGTMKINSSVANGRKYCMVGSDEANTAGWYKIASQTMNGWGDSNITFAVISTFGKYYSGILQLQIRADLATSSTVVSCAVLKWHTRMGFNVGDIICVTEGNTYTLYAYKEYSQYGRIMVEVISESNINTGNSGVVLHNSTSPEAEVPVATVTATDGSTVNAAITASQLTQTQLTNEDLDELRTNNFTSYFARGKNEVINNPFGDGAAFSIDVYRSAYGYITQEALSIDGIKKLRLYSTYSETWSEWRTLAYGDEYLLLTGGKLTGILESQDIIPSEPAMYNIGEDTIPYLNVFSEGFRLRSPSGQTYGGMNISTPGTTETEGVGRLVAGNNVPLGVEHNASGAIRVYGNQRGCTNIYPSNNTDNNVYQYLPTESGTLALDDLANKDNKDNAGLVKSGGDVTITDGIITVNDDSHNHTISNVDGLQKALNNKAELDENGKVPASQLPSYVDDTVEGYLSNGKFYKESAHTTVITGESGKIYIDLHTNKTYRWSGSAYVVISETIALGETSSTAYRGDRGKIAYEHSQIVSGNPHGVTKSDIGLSNVDNTSDMDKPISTAQQEALGHKLDKTENAISATKLQTARKIDGVTFDGSSDITHYGTCDTLGSTAEKIINCTGFNLVNGATIKVKFTNSNTANTISLNVNSTGAKYVKYGNNTINSGQLKANCIYEFVYDSSSSNYFLEGELDTNKTYNAATSSVAGLVKIGYTQSDKNYPVQLNDSGQMYVNVPWTDNNTTYNAATSSALGLVKIGSNITNSSGTISLTKDNVTAALGYTPPTSNTTYNAMTGATSSTAGKAGLVPAPAAGKQTSFLRGDGTWVVPTDTKYTHPTTSGNKHIPSGGSEGQILRWSADGTAVWGNDNNTTYSNFVKSGSGAKAGLVPAPSTTAGTTKYLREDGTWTVPPNTTYSNMTAATSSAAGKAGLVPAPAAGAQSKFLRGDGTWQTPSNRKYCFVGSDTANTNGWYKVASQTMSGYGNVNITFMVTQTFEKYYSGILQLQMRCENTSPITCKLLKWHTRIGFNPEDVICVIDGMTYTIYANLKTPQHARIMFEVLSESTIATSNSGITLYNSTAPETTAPTATVKGSDSTILYQKLKIEDDGGIVKDVMSVYNPTPDSPATYGSEVLIGGGGNVFLGGGESMSNLRNALASADTIKDGESYAVGDEQLYLSSDTDLKLYSSCNTASYRKGLMFDRYGHLYPMITGQTSNLGTSTNPWSTVYAAKGEFTGNVIGAWLQSTAENTNFPDGQTVKKICVQDNAGWIYARTPAQILSDIKALPLAGGTLTGDLISQTVKPSETIKYDLGSSANAYYRAFLNTIALRGTSGTTQSYGGLIADVTGTVDQEGSSRLILGNNIKKGTDDNSSGAIRIFGSGAGQTNIYASNHTDSNIYQYFPAKSGTLALVGEPIFTSKGVNGTAGFIAFAQLKVTGTYVNRPIEFTLSSRGKSTICQVNVLFKNSVTNDPDIDSIVCIGSDYGIFAHKTDTSTWLLYHTKSEAYDSVTVLSVGKPEQTVTISYPDATSTFLTTKPTENVVNSKFGGYLPLLGGGIIEGDSLDLLRIKRTSANSAVIGFENAIGPLGYIGMNTDSNDVPRLRYITKDLTGYNIIDERGGEFTGNITAKYVKGTWLQNTAVDEVASTSSKPKVCVQDTSGWIWTRTLEEFLGDIGAISKSGDTMTGALNVTRVNPVTALTNNLGQSTNPFLSLFIDTIALRGDTSGQSYGGLVVNTVGTTDTVGLSKLSLGNNIASGTANNAKGSIELYGTTTKKTTINPSNTGSDVTLTLPSSDGTLARTADIPDISDRMKFTKYTNESGSVVKVTITISGSLYRKGVNGYLRHPLKICGNLCGTSSTNATSGGTDLISIINGTGGSGIKSLGSSAICGVVSCSWGTTPATTEGPAGVSFVLQSYIGAYGTLWVEHSEDLSITITKS